jgi:2-amino-4-hydroxy-6-hydroxymethyldihydropteridine diphosphokinase
LISASTLVESPPWGRLDQDRFLNGAVCIETSAQLKAVVLLATCKAVEDHLGRQHRERWGPRELDLDLLLQSPDSTEEPELQIPHRDLWRRAFALWPSAQIGWGDACVLLPPARIPTVSQALETLLAQKDMPLCAIFSPAEWLDLPPLTSNPA